MRRLLEGRVTAEKLGDPPHGPARGGCEQDFVPACSPRAALMHQKSISCNNRVTIPAKISSTRRDFLIIGIVECRPADRPG
jgi:hypothetical protein